MLAYVSENSGEKTDVSTAFKIRDPLISEVQTDLVVIKLTLQCSAMQSNAMVELS